MSVDLSQKPLVPTMTGNPVYDAMIGSALMAGSTTLAVTCVTWMNAHGFSGVTQTQLVGAFVGAGGMVVTVVWRFIQSRKTKTAIADHVITAAATGQISEQIKKEAVAAPSIPEAKIEQALENAQSIKENQ